MRKITLHHDGHGLNESFEIIPLQEDAFGAAHSYLFNLNPGPDERLIGQIQFQFGPRNEPGSVPGVTTAAVLAMLIDHLQGFQRGPYPSRQTAIVITKLEEALMWVRNRADERAARGVLGRNEK